MHPAHSVGQLFGRHVFEQISGSAGIERAAQISGARERRKNNDAHGNVRRFSSAATSSPVSVGISMSVMKTSGRDLLHDAQGFVAVAGAGDDLDVVFHLEQRGERAQDHGLIFGNDDADFVALGAAACLSVSQSGGS